MGQITRTTNPTKLKQVDKSHFVVRVGVDASGGKVFWLDSFDYKAAGLNSSLLLSCIAHAGSTEEYFELGSVSELDDEPKSIRGLATDRPLKFRFIFNNSDESLLVGYADGVKALDEAGGLGPSLVDIEPVDLKGVTWTLLLPEGTGNGEKPNVLVEKKIFPTAASAVSHPWFGILVMPEVMRQIALAIAKSPSSLDDSEHWIAAWAGFIESLGVDRPPESDEDELAQQAWSEEVVMKFTAKGIFRHHVARAVAEMEGVQ
ncbi:hypothetical protein [Pseudomonas sp. LS-2]|uniref:hypothetical protein n=1 Tax=Pseudomonas sp. LS-2 TaxID=2315859 RepID=UPI000E74EDE0|nr:hypothetical protein [Pseudomonas sp. LS-2]RJX77884.1 hypothetical protein D3M70_19675 [Pseudomonas sp. LS-2]